MTVHDKTRFLQAFNRLAVAVQLPADRADAATHRIYFDGLQDLSVDAVEAAATQLARDSQWFPKLAEWRTVAERAQQVQVLARALPAGREEPWREECQTCLDTGWQEYSCEGGRQCGRRREHAPHTFVVPCPCRETNHTYQRKRAEERLRVQGKRQAARQETR